MTPTKLAKLYREGKSLSNVASITGINPETVRRMLLKHGVTIRKRGATAGQPQPQRHKVSGRHRQELIKAIADGKESDASLGRRFGLSPQRIRQIAKEQNIKRPSISPEAKERRRKLMFDLQRTLQMKRAAFASAAGFEIDALNNRHAGLVVWKDADIRQSLARLERMITSVQSLMQQLRKEVGS